MLAAALAVLLAAPSTEPAGREPALAAAASGLPAGVVARIGDESISREMFEAYWQALPPSRRNGYEKGGGRKAFLADLVDQKLVVAAAEAKGLLDEPALLAAAELARDAVLYHAFVEREVTRKIVSEDKVKRWYEAHLDRFQVGEMARIRQVLVTPWREKDPAARRPDDAVSDAAAKAKAAKLLAELQAGAEFDEVAGRASEDTAEARAHLLEPFPRGRMAAPVDEAVFRLPLGELSGLIQTTYGYHIIRVEERIAPRVRTLDEVKEHAAREVMEENRSAFTPAFQALTRRLREDIEVKTDESAIAVKP